MGNYNYNFTGIGKFNMNDNGEFELHTEVGIVNISQVLDNIFESQLRPLVYVKIMKNGTSLLMEEDGGLFLHTDDQKVESYFVCGVNLSKLLFYNTGEKLEINIIKRGKTLKYGKVS